MQRTNEKASFISASSLHGKTNALNRASTLPPTTFGTGWDATWSWPWSGELGSGAAGHCAASFSSNPSFKTSSSTSLPRALENPLSSPEMTKPHFSSTRMEAALSLAARA